MLRGQSDLGPEVERIATTIVDSIFAVHMELGAGLLESVYEKCLAWELTSRGLKVIRQVNCPVLYKGNQLDDGLRIDLLVEDQIIIEVKSVKAFEAIHRAQLITYLKLSGLRLGFLVNFNTLLIRDAIKRLVV